MSGLLDPAGFSGGLLNIPKQQPRYRPLANGEFRDNGDGTRSSEISATVRDRDGNWMNIPTLWMGPDGGVELGERGAFSAAEEYQNGSGVSFPRFKDMGSAVDAAKARSNRGGALHSGPLGGQQ